MSEITFLISGSQDEPYCVQFRQEGGRVVVHCTCRAAEFGEHCKHRIALLQGKTKDVVSGNAVELKTALAWVSGSELESALSECLSAEKEVAAAQKKLKAAKRKLAMAMV